jgi:glycine C-acetyltransferase
MSAALTFQSGFMANIAVIGSIVGPGDVVVYDKLSHPSIPDAAHLAGARGVTYRHRSVEDLEAALRRLRRIAGGANRSLLVATDTVFGMEGDVAPLRDICEVAARHSAMVLADDAHGFGVLGNGGRGAVDHFQLLGRVDVEVATLSKALGGLGGFAGSQPEVRARMEAKARPILFSTALLPALAVAAIAALSLLEREPERVETLRSNAEFLRNGLKDRGFNTGASETAIVPVIVKSSETLNQFWEELRAGGIVVQRVEGRGVTPRLRMLVSSEHNHDELDRCLGTIERVGAKIGVV